MRWPATSQGRELRVGDKLGPYRIEELLGEGGMGIVFRAVRESDGADVALKVLKDELRRDDVYQRRIAHEQRAAREVQHKHLVPIYDAGEVDGRQYLVMQYVPGRSLGERIKTEGPLPLDEVLSVAAGVASGLGALHDHGLVHRDVKPSNVLIGRDGTTMLTDFGLAKGRAYTVLTKPGQVMGTLDYLAPELIRGERAGPASDIYALGCLVFECLAGKAVFSGKGKLAVGIAHLEEPPPDPCQNRTDLPASLSWAVLQALEKDPARRPPSATAYATMLRVAASSVVR